MSPESNKTSQPPFVSVIIPVYNDSERLKLCLTALRNQSYPNNRYEVIVVDNGSTDNVEEAVQGFNQILLLNEPLPGAYEARNKGIKHARGEIIALTDSDCIPTSNWIENGVSALISESDCGFVGGRIRLFFQNPKRPSAVEIYQSINAFDQKDMVKNYHHAVTANLFTFKRVFKTVGLFNGSLKSGGDVEWGHRVFSFGYHQLYSEDTCVDHPARHSFGDLFKKISRVEGGLRDWKGPKPCSLSTLAKDFFGLFVSVLALVRRSFLNLSPFDTLANRKQAFHYISVFIFARCAKILQRVRLQYGCPSPRS